MAVNNSTSPSADEIPGAGRLDALYQQQPLPQPQPSGSVDQFIHAAAREALESQSAECSNSGSRKPAQTNPERWTVPVSIAAVMVLGLGLVTSVRHELANYGGQLPAQDSTSEQHRVFSPAPQASAQRNELQVTALAVESAARKQRESAARKPGPALLAEPTTKIQMTTTTQGLAEGLELPDQRFSSAAEHAAPRPEQSAMPATTSGAASNVDVLPEDDIGSSRQRPRPECWLAKIAELHKAGKARQAIQEMRQFRLVYPEFQAPGLKQLPGLLIPANEQ